MRSLFVMDPLASINVATDSTWMLMLESQRRGWPVYACVPGDLHFDGREVRARARRVRCEQQAPWFFIQDEEDLPMATCALVWMRKDPPFDMGYIFTTYLLDLATPVTTVVNDPRCLKLANEKMIALQWPALLPETVVSCDKHVLRAAVEGMGRAVLKPWDGNGGRGVLLTRAGDPNLPAMIEVLTQEGRISILAQRYIPEITAGDKRIILVNGEPRGWMNRIPSPGDHRGNMHIGATVAACTLDEQDWAACEAIAPFLRQWNMIFVGIDMIGGFLTEINVTSPTGIQECNHLQGICLERELVDAAEKLALAHPCCDTSGRA